MRIAHLLLVHVMNNQLIRLVNRLQHENCHVFIHIDKKTPIEPFLVLEKDYNVTLIKNRVFVNWGGYSIVQATLNGFEEIIKSKTQYNTVNLLSGQDYPIKNINYIYDFYKQNASTAFIETRNVFNDWTEAIPRITKFHFPDDRLPGSVLLEMILGFILPKRKIPNSLIPVGRSQWFTLPMECVEYILNYINENSKVVDFFKYTWAPDELFFSTILFNSKYKETIVSNNLRYIDWATGTPSPKVLTIADAESLKNSKCLFARKFNEEFDSIILDFLDEMNNTVAIPSFL